tara:strand:+ start:946 stop:1386 length:441 start_codon:yes stop_codon:yes gene_type:complete
MTKISHDYMKFWRVIRYWAKAKYSITTPDIDMIMFLYSEEYFNKTKFIEFEKLMSWDVKRFDKLLAGGFIQVWRKGYGKNTTLYELSHKGKTIARNIYRKLNGEEIAESPVLNPLFKKDVSYTDKLYRNSIKKLNEFIKQQRYLSH